MNCKNCDNKIEGNFCTYCGQNVKVDRLNLPNFLTEISDSVFQLNRGLFYTIKELFIRPGHAIRDFIQGKRKEYFKPITYVLTLSTLYFLVSQISDNPTLIDDFFSGATDGVQGKNSIAKFPLVEWLSDNYAYTTLLLIPIFSFLSIFHLIFGVRKKLFGKYRYQLIYNGTTSNILFSFYGYRHFF